MNNTFVVFDLETTGLDKTCSSIIEIGAYKYENGVCIDKFLTYIKPPVPISYEITKINGITNEMVADAEPEEVVLPEFLSWLGEYSLVGQNSYKFDVPFLQYRGECVGIDFSLCGKREGWDTLILARKYLNLEHNNLSSLADHFQITLKGDYHTAKYDAMVTKLVFDRFSDEIKLNNKINYSDPNVNTYYVRKVDEDSENKNTGTRVVSKPFKF